AAADPDDSATTKCKPPSGRDYTPFLTADGLKGMRTGIPRGFLPRPATPPRRTGAPVEAGGRGGGRGGFDNGFTPEQKRVMTEAIEILNQQGAEIVDPADIPS